MFAANPGKFTIKNRYVIDPEFSSSARGMHTLCALTRVVWICAVYHVLYGCAKKNSKQSHPAVNGLFIPFRSFEYPKLGNTKYAVYTTDIEYYVESQTNNIMLQ